jgi:hypothetical protein
VPFIGFLADDKHATDSAWAALAGGRNRRLIVELRDTYACIATTAGEEKSDGYLTADRIASIPYIRPDLVEVMCRPVLGRAPKVHKRGEECDSPHCLPHGWPDGYDYHIHDWLKGNPTRKSVALKDAKKADSKDRALRALVLLRDGPYCRYCWSGPLSSKAAGRAKDRRVVLEFDHVDPSLPAGADGTNYVVACDKCQDDKGPCTPELANMELLPVPTPADIARLPVNHAGGRSVLDRPNQSADHPFHHLLISERSPDPINTSADPVNDRSLDQINDPVGDRSAGQISGAGVVRPRSADQDSISDPVQGVLLSGSGRAGHPGDPALDPSLEVWRPEPRPASSPDPYSRSSRPPPPTGVWLRSGKPYTPPQQKPSREGDSP